MADGDATTETVVAEDVAEHVPEVTMTVYEPALFVEYEELVAPVMFDPFFLHL